MVNTVLCVALIACLKFIRKVTELMI